MNKENTAFLRYASVAPDKDQADKIREALSKKFNNPDLKLEVIKDKKITGGFIVNYGNFEYDWSDEGRTRQLREIIQSSKKKSNVRLSEIKK